MKKIIIGVTGSIAAYKACEVISLLKKKNQYDIEVIMTKNATQFVSPLTFGALINKPVLIDDFDETGYQIKHIQIVKNADCFVIVPATANIIAKIANGISDDVLTSAFLAATCPKLIAPAMNVNMYDNLATQRNIERCLTYGIRFIDPAYGKLACGDVGRGKLADVEDIVDLIEGSMYPQSLHLRNVLITAGPTQEALDPVRYITNHSSGKMGYELAKSARNLGAHVTLITGPTHLKKPYGVDIIEITSAMEMFEETKKLVEYQDYIIMAAAVGDYRPKTKAEQKIKKADQNFNIELEKNLDILNYVGNIKTHQTLCGFAMETENVIENAKKKFVKKNCDLLVVNDLFEKGAGFKGDTNKVAFITKNFVEYKELMSKSQLADLIIDKLRKIKGE